MKNELECSVCNSPMEEDEGIEGYFGICPVSFCCWCYSSITDMVIQMNGFDDIDMLKERIKELEEDAEQESKRKKAGKKKKKPGNKKV